jgi:hypothetical protein
VVRRGIDLLKKAKPPGWVAVPAALPSSPYSAPHMAPLGRRTDTAERSSLGRLAKHTSAEGFFAAAKHNDSTQISSTFDY